jgi:putative spermidine/putrescine transport system permease protein
LNLSRLARWSLRLIAWLGYAFLYLPLVVVAILSFNEAVSLSWPPQGFTLDWWRRAWETDAPREAMGNSIRVALAATAIALVLGTLAAFAMQRYRFFGQQTFSFLLVLPIALPGIVTAVALQNSFNRRVDLGPFDFRIGFGFHALVIAHATFCVVIAYNNVIARLRRLPRTPEEASADLGADTWITFRRITMPGMRTALLSGALLAFALSFDEVIVTVFTAGAGTQTIPLWVLGAMQRPTQLPVVNVVALVLIVISTVPVYFAQRLSDAGESGAGGRI